MTTLTIQSRDPNLFARVIRKDDGTLVQFFRRTLWHPTHKGRPGPIALRPSAPMERLLGSALIDDSPFHVIRDRVADILVGLSGPDLLALVVA